MEALRKILEIIKGKKDIKRVPGAWIGEKGMVEKDICALLRTAIRDVMQSNLKKPTGRTIKGSIYAVLPRALTALADEKSFYGGTLLKALLYLPQLKEMGVEMIYLLPIFQISGAYKKGELSSPYAIRDFFKLDESLHDNILGEYGPEIVDLAFAAFVQAAHALGMRVMMDFVFRTVARDNCLIKDHPDWFYWKKTDVTNPPPVGDFPPMTFLSDSNLERIYQSEGFKTYAAQFVRPPVADKKWRQTASEGLSAVESAYGITTMPAFSDVINDVQPFWSDVTYLKYDFGRSRIARAYTDPDMPPFILYDSIKLDLYEAQEPNIELWDTISDILPYYIKKFNIDGARIDMGHALPSALNERIIKAAREIKQDFIFWSEMLCAKNSAQAEKDGFDFISGATWCDYRKETQEMLQSILLELNNSALPVASALETPDTERAATLFPIEKLKMLYAFNLLLPNTVPIFTNGFEVLEKQPMNLGLCKCNEAKYALEPKDPFYCKLAFFDAYSFHWGNEPLHSWIAYYGELRKKFYDLITKENMTVETNGGVVGIRYMDAFSVLYAVFNFEEKMQSGKMFYGDGYKLKAAGLSYDLKSYGVMTVYAQKANINQ